MSKYNAHGTLLALGDALVSPTYTTVAQITGLGGPSQSRGTTPVPTHDDSGGVDKIADALYDGGQVSGTLLYDPAHASHDESTGLQSIMASGAERPWRITFPSSLGQFDFNGFLTAFEPTGMDANSGLLRANFTVEVSGDITQT